jgi:hypothetical protein
MDNKTNPFSREAIRKIATKVYGESYDVENPLSQPQKVEQPHAELCETSSCELILSENVNMNILSHIVKNFDVLYPRLGRFVDSSYSEVDKETAKNTLVSMLRDRLNSNKVGYKFSGKSHSGRLYSVKPSLQGISRVVRHTIAGDIMWDLDMDNAHPYILKFYCDDEAYPCPVLTMYINDREPILKELMEKHDITRDEAKRVLLSLLNGGSPKYSTDFTRKFDNECKNIRKYVCESNPNLYNRAKKAKGENGYNLEGSATNYMLCIKENEILQIIYNELVRRNIIVGALVFDGLMIEKRSMPDINDVKLLLRDLEKVILLHYGHPIKLSVKPMNEGIDLTIDEDMVGKTEIDKLITDKFTKELTVGVKDVEYCNSKYLPDLDTSIDITAVCSGCGSGKSYQSARFMENKKRVLCVSPRRSYAQNITNRFKNMACYLDKDFTPDRIVCQVESLHKLPDRNDYDLLVLDEIESILSQLSSSTLRGKRMVTYMKLESLIRNAGQILLFDAYLTPRTINLLKDFKLDFKLVINSFRTQEYTMITHDMNERAGMRGYFIDRFISSMIQSIQSGKRIFVVSSSLKKAETIFDALSKLENKKIGIHSSQTKASLDGDVHKLWAKDAMIITSSVTVGIDHTLEWFDEIWMYAGAGGPKVHDIFQGASRIRNLKDNTVNVCLAPEYPFHKHLITDFHELMSKKMTTQLVTYKELLEEGICPRISISEWIGNLLARNEIDANVSNKFFHTEFEKYAERSGWATEEKKKPIDDTLLETFNIPTDQHLKFTAINDISSSTVEEYQKLMIEGADLSILQKNELTKYFFLQKFADLEFENIWLLYDFCYMSKKRAITSIIEHASFEIANLSKYDLLKYTDDMDISIIPTNYLKKKIVLALHEKLGITSSFENAVITREAIENVFVDFPYTRKQIDATFKLRDLELVNKTKSKKIKERTITGKNTDILTEVFSRWSGFVVKAGPRVRKRLNGKIVDASDFQFLDNTHTVGLHRAVKPYYVKDCIPGKYS